MSETQSETQKYKANQIKVLSGLTAVRKRPSMYIGNTGTEGLHHLVYEVVDNSIDEALAGFCTEITVTIHDNNAITVEDNGRGIPVDLHPTEGISALELVMTKLHAGGKFDNQTYKVSGGLHGVGISVVNALSKYLKVEVYRDNFIYCQEYKKGIAITKLEQKEKTEKRGTKVYFEPDPEIFKETTVFQYEILKSRMRELAFLNPQILIKLNDKRFEREDEFHFKGGIVSFVEYKNINKEVVNEKPVFIKGEKDDVQVEVAFQYNRGYNEKILSYVNNIRTKEGGTHVSGFRQSLTTCINRYASEDIIPKKLKEKLNGDDVREGLTCIISVRVPDPQFEGQTKTKLGNSEVRSIVTTIVNEQLSTYLEEHPDIAKKILSKAVDAARAREAARRAKELSRKKGSNNDIMMAGKLAECQSKNPSHREIFIVEGDSAGGSAKQGRDRVYQAILPLRGKIMNVEKARFDKMLASEEIRNLVGALGTGIGHEDFNDNLLRYHKIIIMTDADVDGAHIRTLLLTFFYRQMPSLIEKGYLYVAQPPLYRIHLGKKKELFLKDDEDMNNYLFDKVVNDISIQPSGYDLKIKGPKLKRILQEVSNCYDNIELLNINNYWKELVEDLLIYGLSDPAFFEDKNKVKDLADYLKSKGYKTTEIKSSESEKFHNCYHFNAGVKDLAYMTADICADIINSPEFKRSVKYYSKIQDLFLTDKVTVYKNEEIIEEFDKLDSLLFFVKNYGIKGLSFQRYKGLGEMNPEQLWETTMNPEKRTLLQVNIQDADEAENLFTTLMGEKIEPRKEFIQNHALEVNELDI